LMENSSRADPGHNIMASLVKSDRARPRPNFARNCVGMTQGLQDRGGE
jgi:hypothetical protein